MCNTTLSKIQFSVKDVRDALSDIDARKATGFGGIPALFWKNCSSSLCLPLLYLFNVSLLSGVFPQCLKFANITPVSKSGDPSLPKSYRPVSLLPILSKVFERLVFSALYFHLKSVICPEQHGFLPGRSTTTNLVVYVQDIANALDQKHEVDAIHSDLSRAFDRLSHKLLIYKLNYYGCCGGVLSWLSSYLTDRFQRVVYKGCSSEWRSVLSGVPQGSLLGPLLFILYMNDLPGVVKSSKVLMYADDVKIYKKITNSRDCEALQQDVNLVSDWFRRWDLTVNVEKCQSITFSRKLSSRDTHYSIDNNRLNRVSEIKDLGVLFSDNLRFSAHIGISVRKAFRCLGFIKRQSTHFTSLPAIKCLYTTFVTPILEYASQVWNTENKTTSKNLERVQRKFVKYLCFKGKINYSSDNYSQLCTEFKLNPLRLRRKIFDLVFLKKIITGDIDCNLLLDSLHFRIPRPGSRLKTSFHIPRSRTSMHQSLHSVHRMCKAYNEVVNEPGLPDIFLTSINTFRLSMTRILKD